MKGFNLASAAANGSAQPEVTTAAFMSLSDLKPVEKVVNPIQFAGGLLQTGGEAVSIDMRAGRAGGRGFARIAKLVSNKHQEDQEAAARKLAEPKKE